MSTLHVPTNGSIASKSIALTVDADLMRNQAPATVVDPRNGMAVISDQAGNPMLFSVGNDGVLYVLVRDAESRSGWKQYNLTSALGAQVRVTTFTVSQGKDRRIILAAAVAPANAPLETTLYLTPPITPDATLTRWAEIDRQWVARPFPTGVATITEILIGAADDQELPLGIVGVRQGDSAELHCINTDASDETWLWKPFPLPENAAGPILDIAVGKVLGDWGVYALYPTNTGQTIAFTSLPDPRFHKSSRYEFPLPARAAAIAALPTDTDSFDLYFAGEGIHLYAGSGSSLTTIAGSAAASDVRQLLVCHDDATAAVYAVSGEQTLSYCGGMRSKAGTWAPPVPIRQQVTQVTAMRSSARLSNEIFIVKANSSLVYIYQDAVRSLWNETPISLPALDKIVETPTYTAHIKIEADNGAALLQQQFSLTASSWAYATINGYAFSLDDKRPVTVSPDMHGVITIIIPTETIAAPVIHLSAGFLTQVVDIVPTTNVHAGLEKIRSGVDLRDATLKDGSALLVREVADETLDSSAQAVQQLTRLVQAPPPAQPRSFAGFARPAGNIPARSLLVPAPGHVWGMHFDGGVAHHLEGAAASAHFSARWQLPPRLAAANAATASLNAAELDTGSALEWLWDRIKDIGSFLVESFQGAVSFVFHIGKELFRFVVDTAEAAYRLIHWVLLKTLDIDLDKFIRWLGFLFDWDDILRVRNMMIGLTNDAMTYGRSQIDGFRQQVAAKFEELKRQAKALKPDTDARSVYQRAREFQGEQAGADATRERVMNSPGGNWGQYHLSHSGALETDAPVRPVSDPLSAFMTDVVMPTLDSVSHTAQQLGVDLDALFNDETLTLGQAMQMLAGDLVIGLIDAAEKIVTGLMQLVEDLLALVQQSLNTPIQIPFFSAFYKGIAGNELTILDAVALVVAVPMTVIYKLVTNKTPELLPGTVIFPGATDTAAGAHGSVSLAAQETPSGSTKHELSAGQKAYQHWGGTGTLILQVLSDGIGVMQAIWMGDADAEPNFDKSEQLYKDAEKLGPWRAGFDIVKQAGAFPLGNDPEVPAQVGLWFFELASPIIEMAIHHKVSPGDRRNAKGVWTILDAVTVGTIECVIFAKEMIKEDGSERGMDGFKFAQNMLYAIGGIGTGALCLVPRGSTAAAYAIAGALAGTTLGAILNGVRLLLLTLDSKEYQRY